MKTLLAATALVAFATPALAVNVGFETGDTTGWTASPAAGAATSFGPFTPFSGTYLGYAAGGEGEGVYATLSQTFNLLAGRKITGVVGFYAGDYLPFDDDGYLAINGNVIFSASVGSLGTQGNSGWVPFSFTTPSAGAYTLVLAGRNVGDNAGGTTGSVIDAVTVSGAVPEASTWAMLIAGFGLVGAVSRRRRIATAA